jgi:hypothetical protein
MAAAPARPGEAPDSARLNGARQALLAAGTETRALRAFLDEWGGDRTLLLTLLRQAWPARVLEVFAATPPYGDDPVLAAALAGHVRMPPHAALRLLPALSWAPLARIASEPWLAGAVRVRAEGLLLERFEDLRLGERVALARLATRTLLRRLLSDSDARVLGPALFNPRLGESALCAQLRAPEATRLLCECVAACPRWRGSYAVRFALVLQPLTPLGLALAQLTSLVPADLRRVAGARNLAPLVVAAAERALAGGPEGGP